MGVDPIAAGMAMVEQRRCGARCKLGHPAKLRWPSGIIAGERALSTRLDHPFLLVRWQIVAEKGETYGSPSGYNVPQPQTR